MATQGHLQLTLAVTRAAYEYGARSDGEVHGVVLTRPQVVNLILDLAGYDDTRDLSVTRLLEPSVGQGAFLIPAVERLLASCARWHRDPRTLEWAILAFDIDPAHVAISRANVAAALRKGGLTDREALRLALAWIVEGDFLLAPLTRTFDFVIGNPPTSASRILRHSFRLNIAAATSPCMIGLICTSPSSNVASTCWQTPGFCPSSARTAGRSISTGRRCARRSRAITASFIMWIFTPPHHSSRT